MNHLHFCNPLTESTVDAFRGATEQVVAAGALAVRVAQVDDTHLILLLDFRSSEDAARVAREIEARARDTERSVGEVIASAQA